MLITGANSNVALFYKPDMWFEKIKKKREKILSRFLFFSKIILTMWVKLKHQPIKEGALLAKGVSKDDQYNKMLLNVFIVQITEDGQYDLQTFIIEPDMMNMRDGIPPMMIPIDIPMSYENLVKEHWHIWID